MNIRIEQSNEKINSISGLILIGKQLKNIRFFIGDNCREILYFHLRVFSVIYAKPAN